jgi:hypothetical protein
VRRTTILIAILILGVSLATGLLVGSLAGGGDREAPYATPPIPTPTATHVPRSPVPSPSPAATDDGFVPPRLVPWT